MMLESELLGLRSYSSGGLRAVVSESSIDVSFFLFGFELLLSNGELREDLQRPFGRMCLMTFLISTIKQ